MFDDLCLYETTTAADVGDVASFIRQIPIPLSDALTCATLRLQSVSAGFVAAKFSATLLGRAGRATLGLRHGEMLLKLSKGVH